MGMPRLQAEQWLASAGSAQESLGPHFLWALSLAGQMALWLLPNLIYPES